MGTPVTHSAAEVRDLLEGACAQRELVILETPYLRFQSAFLQLDPDAVHARVTMGAEEAQFGLRSGDLRLRFPSATRFLEGRTKLLGFGLVEGRRTLRLALPSVLKDEDQRRAYRVDRVGRIEVSYSTPRFELRTANLVNLSTTGARLHAQERLEDTFRPGDPITVTIPLTSELRINSPAVVRWLEGRLLGLEFHPPLQDRLLADLSRWVFLKREEDRDRLAGPGAAPLPPRLGGRSNDLALVSPDEGLQVRLEDLLHGVAPLRRLPPTVAALKETLYAPPALVVFHLASLGLDERKRLRILAETLAGRVPFLLLGTGLEAAPLLELATELKAVSGYVLGDRPGPFFARLIQGILRRQEAP